MALRTLPEQLRAAVVTLEADVRVEEEDRVTCGLDVALDQPPVEVERQQHQVEAAVGDARVRAVAAVAGGDVRLDALGIASPATPKLAVDRRHTSVSRDGSWQSTIASGCEP